MATQTVRALSIAFESAYAFESLEGESQTYRIGAPLVWSSGALIEASADPTNIVGLALEAGANVTGTANRVKRRYAPLLPGTIVEGNLVSGATGNHTVLGTAIGIVCSLIKRTTESDVPWAFDAADQVTANASFRIVGFRDASADINP